MNLATVILTHSEPELTADTVKSVQAWVGERVLVLVDQVGWSEFQNFKIARTEQGFLHAHKRSPYRNYALGLKNSLRTGPTAIGFSTPNTTACFVLMSFKKI